MLSTKEEDENSLFSFSFEYCVLTVSHTKKNVFKCQIFIIIVKNSQTVDCKWKDFSIFRPLPTITTTPIPKLVVLFIVPKYESKQDDFNKFRFITIYRKSNVTVYMRKVATIYNNMNIS